MAPTLTKSSALQDGEPWIQQTQASSAPVATVALPFVQKSISILRSSQFASPLWHQLLEISAVSVHPSFESSASVVRVPGPVCMGGQLSLGTCSPMTSALPSAWTRIVFESKL